MAVVRRQEGRGSARNLARAPLNWASQGQRWGRCKVRRRAERVSLPAMEKKRRRRVLVVTICSPRPMRAVQRARLWAITWTASQAPFGRLRIGGEAARGEMVQPHAVLEVSDGVLDLGVAPMVGLEIQGFPPDRGRYGLKSGCDIAWEGAPPSGILVVRPPDAGDPRCAFPANAIRCKKRLNRIYLTSPSHN